MRSPRALTLLALLAPFSASFAGDLAGSAASMEEQHAAAVESDYSFLRRPADVERMVEIGRLVELERNAGDYALSDVSFPFARPEVRTFIESVAADYRDTFGAPLVVTSLTRPSALQPANAHELSVHPAGMAVDLRVPADAVRRAWLETRLLALEDSGAIDVTREMHPSHYHVAVFGERYFPIAHAEAVMRRKRRARAEVERLAAAAATATATACSDAAPDRSSVGWLLLAILLLGVAVPRAILRRRVPSRH